MTAHGERAGADPSRDESTGGEGGGRTRLGELVRLVWRYSASSVIAGVISAGAFLLCYAVGVPPGAASVIAFLAGAVPNYVIGRCWAWQRRGRPDAARELLPYVAVVVTTAVAAAVVTTAADAWLTERVTSEAWRAIGVATAFVATYGFMFVLKFLLFDRFVFRTRRTVRTPATRSGS